MLLDEQLRGAFALHVRAGDEADLFLARRGQLLVELAVELFVAAEVHVLQPAKAVGDARLLEDLELRRRVLHLVLAQHHFAHLVAHLRERGAVPVIGELAAVVDVAERLHVRVEEQAAGADVAVAGDRRGVPGEEAAAVLVLERLRDRVHVVGRRSDALAHGA